MSLCDRCFSPGYCCKRLSLHGLSFWVDEGVEAVWKYLTDHGLPFEPAGQRGQYRCDDSGRLYADYYFNCPKLSPDGRCTIYKDRPDCCRNYEPASDGLCCHFRGAEGDERNILP